MRDAHWKRAGHCTRCGEPFGGNRLVRYMVREYVVWRTLYRGDGDVTMILHGGDAAVLNLVQKETVPVCAACLTVHEEAGAWIERACPGCGQIMACDTWHSNTCSDACRQRIRRARRRAVTQQSCASCELPFSPVRVDARYCSPACRQKAYRQRKTR